MERELSELWPGLARWVGASETTNRGVSSDHRSPRLLPYCLTTEERNPDALCCNTGSNWPKHGARALALSGALGGRL